MDSPRLCAEILLAQALEWHRIDLYTRFEEVVPAEALDCFRELIRRRAAREPIQHLTGGTEFWSLPIQCDARAFVPRPETEVVVQVALSLLADRTKPVIADLGTGTGCIAIALARELPEATIVASDLSADAPALAAENVAAQHLDDRIRLLEGDLAAPLLADGLGGCFDLVACNPPYIADSEMETLPPEVRDHDPRIALSGGPDGLDVTRRLVQECPALLKPGGFLVIEMGKGQAASVTELFNRAGWCDVKTHLDTAGIERVIAAARDAGSDMPKG